MGFWSDMKVLYHFNFKPTRGETHAERLESFYRGQADAYDDYRQRLLKGRRELWEMLEIPRGGVWIDMGCGTGSNLEYLGPRVGQLKTVYLVDLCPSLLEVARQRARRLGWNNVRCVQADVTTFVPDEGHADVITFSYSLTMIPDWYVALEHAHALLNAGGRIGVVDFYYSRKFPAEGMVRHRGLTRQFWPWLFGTDNVILSPDHLPYLQHRFQTRHVSEHLTRIPYILLLRAPYYLFVGAKV